jgi:hypothetical protein
MTEAVATPPITEPKRGWRKVILALAVFAVVPAIPQFASILPVAEPLFLFVPAMAVCALVGWWAGGRPLAAILWVAMALLFIRQAAFLSGGAPSDVYSNLLRGWTLLVTGAFGIACVLGGQRSFFSKALLAVGAAFTIALIMSLFGPVTLSQASSSIAQEFARRNAAALDAMQKSIASNGEEWKRLTTSMPALVDLPGMVGDQLSALSRLGRLLFPALLAFETIAALAVAWATYHRLSRQRIGSPLAALRDFRFNDQLVWGLIVGLVILLLPNLAGVRGFGRNLVLFFGVLYALRGLGVLAWFMAPGRLTMLLIAGLVMLFLPFINYVAALGFLTLIATALGLGVGDTWADWRSRARSTLS